ncbi:hypothetical protein D9758_006611 [Tetrapyrgos nigripes]|uniref:Uncharacterized protein n=1 Tax=Tetrapyrgos nigripes TaxID=182062 RepID=A0A8H5GJ11_9AGAR|nr:hypothetical protein D9758_006611 [Tetrapyrgos nigripes]
MRRANYYIAFVILDLNFHITGIHTILNYLYFGLLAMCSLLSLVTDPRGEDYYRTFRINLLLAWTLSNGLVAAAVVSANSKAQDSSDANAVKGLDDVYDY